ncbi:MAG: pyrroline-5-carboxylate reductase [Pseudomonadota bacterium]
MKKRNETWPRVAIIGGGQMARALVGGWLARGAPAENIAIADPAEAQRDWLARRFQQIALHADNAKAAAQANVWVMAVKPQQLAEVAGALAILAAEQRPLVISIVAGIGAADLSRWLGGHASVVRAMPNRPALIGAGVTGLYAGSEVGENDRATTERLLEAVGTAVWVGSESDIDLVTAVSGSGPAYFFLLIELLEAAAIAQGLPPEVARKLAVGTAAGAAALAKASGEEPSVLREQVTSKGGTTAAALEVFREAGLDMIVARAVAAAAERSREIAAEFGAAR